MSGFDKMTGQEAQRKGLQLSEGLIMWNLFGRSEAKRISTGTSETHPEQRSKQPENSGLPQERSVLESRDNGQLVILESFPPEVQLCWSSIPGYRLGVMATTFIPQGVWIGPYQGKPVKPDCSHAKDGTYLWEIFQENRLLCYIDGSDINSSSWMRFIQCARSSSEQNLDAFQYQGNIYYRVLRNIHVGEELLVWYDDSYPQYMGIPLMNETEPQATNESTQMLLNTNKKKRPLDTSAVKTSISSAAQEHRKKTNDDEIALEPQAKISQTCNTFDKENLTSKKSLFKNNEVLNGTQKQGENLSSERVSPSSSLATEPIPPDQSSSDDDRSSMKCGQCSKNFTQRYTLQMHLCPKRTNSPYQCGHCNLLFTNPSDLRGHVVNHVSERPFKCGFCMRSFAGSTTLSNHIRTHTGEKPFNCLRCGVMFTQGAQYARHLRLDCNGNLSRTNSANYKKIGDLCRLEN